MNDSENKFPTVFILLLALGIVFILFLNTTLSTPINFGDEGLHTRLSQWIAEKKEYPVWTPFVSTNLDKINFARPPLFNTLQASFLFAFGYHEFIIKIFTPFISILTVLSSFLLVKRLYNKTIGLISSIILVTFPSFITYSVLFYNESLFLFYTTLSILLLLLSIKDNNKKYWVLSALFASLAFLTKHNGIIFLVFLPLIGIYWLIYEKSKRKIDIFRDYFVFGVIFLLMLSPFLLRNFNYYKTPLCYPLPFFDTSGCAVLDFKPKYEFEIRTLQGGSENNLMRFGLVNFVNFAYGEWSIDKVPLKFLYKPIEPLATYIAKNMGLTLSSFILLMGGFAGLIIMIMKRSHINLILLIILFTSLLVFYQSRFRAEDAARYVLLWAPIIAIISAFYWNEIYKILNKYHKYFGIVIFVILLLIGYQSVVGRLSTMANVKQFSPSFFEACDWVKENLPEDSMLLTFWGYRAVYNCQRNIASAYADIRLSNDPQYITDVSKQHGITHLFIQKFSISGEPSRESYSIDFVRLLETNPVYFEKVYENGPSLDDCFNQGICDGNIIYKIIGVAA